MVSPVILILKFLLVVTMTLLIPPSERDLEMYAASNPCLMLK